MLKLYSHFGIFKDFIVFFAVFSVIVYVNKSILIVITHLYYVNAIYYFNNTIEVAMLLLGLNSFITNVIGLVIKTRYIIGMTTGIKTKPLMIPSLILSF
ncbi:hypothetical protein MJ561_13915 [Klebsiella pneumoniae]|nr:hypothetical protein MJ561_13915 [Klebsiella pneumoniae]